MLDINFLTRDQTQAPARESVESTDSTTREVPPLTAFNIFSLSLIFAALIIKIVLSVMGPVWCSQPSFPLLFVGSFIHSVLNHGPAALGLAPART